jgi:hypothetical protein
MASNLSKKEIMIKKIGYLLTVLVIATSIVNAQQQGPPPCPPSPEARLKHVSERLYKGFALKPEQKKKVLDAYKTFLIDMEKLCGKNTPPMPPGKKEDMTNWLKPGMKV